MSIVGSDLILQSEFRNRSGVLIDPDSVTASVKDPAGDLLPVTFQPTTRVGFWEAKFRPEAKGRFWLRVVAVGSGINGIQERHFDIEASNVV